MTETAGTDRAPAPPLEEVEAPRLKVRRLSPDAVLPRRATIGSAGYDICALEEGVIPAGTRKLVPSGLSLEIPPGHYGRIAPRSGLSIKFGLDVAAGMNGSLKPRTTQHNCAFLTSFGRRCLRFLTCTHMSLSLFLACMHSRISAHPPS